MVVRPRKERPAEGYRIRPTLPAPWGRVGPWQTGFHNRRQAQQVDAWMRSQALERPALIDALVEHRFSLRDAWVAKLRGTLDELLAGITDPTLEDAVRSYRPVCGDERARQGLDQLLELADPGVRLSWLAGSNVSRLYAAARAAGQAPATVRRGLHRAVSELLLHHLGEQRRTEAMLDVQVPSGATSREVHVSREELRALLDHCEPAAFRDLVTLAILLAIDRAPLLRIRPRYVDLERGLLEVLDRKTSARTRTIELSTPALAILRRRAAGLLPDAPVFDLSASAVRNAWEAARDAAAGRPSRNVRRTGGVDDPVGEAAEERLSRDGVVTLPLLRFKDLRHLLPTAWNALGLPADDLPGVMGWARGSRMSEVYTTARIRGDRDHLDAVARFLGLEHVHLQAM